MDAVHDPHTVGEALTVKASDHHLQVDKVEEVVGQDIPDDKTHFVDDFSGHGLSHAKLVGDLAVTAGGGG